MAVMTFVASFHNTTHLKNILDEGSFLYWATLNSGVVRLVPDNFKPADKVWIRAGELEPWQDGEKWRPKTGAVFYIFDLPKITVGGAVGGIDFGPDWACRPYENQRGKYLAFTPKRDIEVHKDTIVSVPTNRVFVGEAASQESVELNLICYVIDGMTGRGGHHHIPFGLHLAMRQRPGTQALPPLTDVLECVFLGGKEKSYGAFANVEFVEFTPADGGEAIQNAFFLELRPKLGGGDVLAADGTQMVLSFSGTGAGGGLLAPTGPLASYAEIAQFDVRPGPHTNWRVHAETDMMPPCWRITVPAGEPLSGQLHVQNVVSTLDWGWTELILKYDQVPGHRAGQFQCPMYKFGAPFLEIASANQLWFHETGDMLYINWLGRNANLANIDWIVREGSTPWGGSRPGLTANLGDAFPESGLLRHRSFVYHPTQMSLAEFHSSIPFTSPAKPQLYGNVDLSPGSQITLINRLSRRLSRKLVILERGMWLAELAPPEFIEPGGTVICVVAPELLRDSNASHPMNLHGHINYAVADEASLEWPIHFFVAYDERQLPYCWVIVESDCFADTDDKYSQGRPGLVSETIAQKPPSQFTDGGAGWICTAETIRAS